MPTFKNPSQINLNVNLGRESEAGIGRLEDFTNSFIKISNMNVMKRTDYKSKLMDVVESPCGRNSLIVPKYEGIYRQVADEFVYSTKMDNCWTAELERGKMGHEITASYLHLLTLYGQLEDLTITLSPSKKVEMFLADQKRFGGIEPELKECKEIQTDHNCVMKGRQSNPHSNVEKEPLIKSLYPLVSLKCDKKMSPKLCSSKHRPSHKKIPVPVGRKQPQAYRKMKLSKNHGHTNGNELHKARSYHRRCLYCCNDTRLFLKSKDYEKYFPIYSSGKRDIVHKQAILP